MSTRIMNETTLRISVPRNYEITSLTVPQVFATLHTPEIIATSISETITATAQATSNLNTQGTPFTYGPTA
jgi:hypothetical protein